MSCQNMQHQWKKYKDGTLTDAEIEELERHTEECDECMNYLQNLLDEEEIQPVTASSTFDHEKAKRSMIRAKWRQRFTNVLTVLSAITLLWLGGSFLSVIYYSFTHKSEYLRTVDKAAIESALPNVYVQNSKTEAKPFFRLQNEYTLYKEVGHEQKSVGQYTFHHLFERVTNVDKNFLNDHYNMKLSFAYPERVKQEKDPSFYQDWSNETWGALDQLPEGTVSEVALSFDQAYTMEEIEEKLSSTLSSDISPVWYALDTGYETKGSDTSNPLVDLTSSFGFPSMLELPYYEEKETFTDEERVVQMLKVLADNERTVQQIRWMNPDDLQLMNRYKFVKKNGVRIYGIVLTGPTKELLKLKNEPSITYSSLGEVELWNWFTRPTQGTLH
ncbi:MULTISPECIES: anti sigma factor C-terminal domain-containing protein [Bacillaceae]|uniref:anti sigma factor C-terminal domain-containing protein n=1 Tax=Bacillaceae TaxID=186817 RepID=UPI0010527A2B|nr:MULTISPECIES: anti sigma factor C-terminal domain-containing protein [Bacillaceae]MDT2047101.1 anti sigma factor C-terminal domain-containing protein [Priestia flexa]TDB54872.1 sigma-M negative effector [Bacillus sp. CBEL-1]USY56773.1 anti-sigma factor [Bacillus sp. 1780r2a1]